MELKSKEKLRISGGDLLAEFIAVVAPLEPQFRRGLLHVERGFKTFFFENLMILNSFHTQISDHAVQMPVVDMKLKHSL